MISLVDCNNFYVSCERVFQPHLENKPVIILSNNDGCAVARSNEAKVLGIKMGQPFFEIKELCEKNKVFVFSSNYTLYADLSSRVMEILKQFGVRREVYSIDESFVDLTGIPNLTEHGQQIRKNIKQWVGIPVCVGLGETKVLAKFANHLAKKHAFLNSVCNLQELGENRVNNAMRITSVSEVWGVGRKSSEKLELMGIKTAYDLKIANAKHLRNVFNINIEKIIYELNGHQCIKLEEYTEPNKQIVSSRSFGVGVTAFNDLLSSISYHIEQGCNKLRKQGLFARQLTIFINSNRFQADYYYNSETILLPCAIDSFRHMIKYMEPILKKLYNPNLIYKKSGIMLTNLITSESETVDLFDNINIEYDLLLPTIEQIKHKYGKFAIGLAVTQLSDTWKMRNNHISKSYTSNLDDIILAK